MLVFRKILRAYEINNPVELFLKDSLVPKFTLRMKRTFQFF